MKDKLKHGGMSLQEVLEAAESDDVIGKMKVSAVLEALPGIGKVRATQMMEKFKIAESRRVRGPPVAAEPHESANRAVEGAARLTVLSGPSGVGKGSVVAEIRRHHPSVWLSVSVTTRFSSEVGTRR